MHRLRLKLALLAASVALTLVAIEVFIGVTGIAVKGNSRFVPGKGGIYVPHSRYRHTHEGFSEGRFNSHGFRDYERTREKPPGTYRIAVLGDSFVEAFQVDLADSFPALLDRHFEAAHPSRDIEVMAFGHSGFGTSDSLMCYLNYAAEFSPDMVVLAFLTWNDFKNNHPKLSPGDIRFFHQVGEDGRLVVDSSRIDGYEQSLTLPKRAFQATKQRSYLVSMLSRYLHLQRRQQRHQEFEAAGGSWNAALPSTADGTATITRNNGLNIFLEEPAPVWVEAYGITARILEAFNDEVTARGGQFVVASLSNSKQVHPELQSALEASYGRQFDYDRPDRFLAETAGALGIPFLKLYPALLQYHLETGEYVHGFGDSRGGHWNETGHRVAAEQLFEFLEPLVIGTTVASD